MGLFMAFIICMGTAMVMSNNDDLIEKDYYEKGLNYDKEYNEQTKAIKDSVIPDIEVNGNGLTISFPYPAHYTLVCKRLADASMDKIFEGTTDEDRVFEIPAGDIERGTWRLELTFYIDGEEYKTGQNIVMP